MTDYYTLVPAETFATARILDEMRGNLAGLLAHAQGTVELDEPIHWELTPSHSPTDWAMGLPPGLLLSSRFRGILDQNLGDRDDIQWIESEVQTPDGAVIQYWTPHFPSPLDVLDEVNTQWGPNGGIPMRWFLDRQKVGGVRVTPIPMLSVTLVVDAGVHHELRRAGLTGFQALSTRVTA
jgi:hypothetical protein